MILGSAVLACIPPAPVQPRARRAYLSLRARGPWAAGGRLRGAPGWLRWPQSRRIYEWRARCAGEAGARGGAVHVTALATSPLPPAGYLRVPGQPPPPRLRRRLALSSPATASPSLPAGAGGWSLRSPAPPPHVETPSPAAAVLRPQPLQHDFSTLPGIRGCGGVLGCATPPAWGAGVHRLPFLIFPQSRDPQGAQLRGFVLSSLSSL